MYSSTLCILSLLMNSNWADRLLLAVERRALRLLISASWVGVLVVGEDILMGVVERGGEEGFVTEERWVGLLLMCV